jgi:hypothetical protein
LNAIEQLRVKLDQAISTVTVARGVDSEGQQILLLEAEVVSRKIHQSADEEAGCNHQHKTSGDLKDDQRLSQAMAVTPA